MSGWGRLRLSVRLRLVVWLGLGLGFVSRGGHGSHLKLSLRQFHLPQFASGQFHEDRDKVKINKYFYSHCKLIALTQAVI